VAEATRRRSWWVAQEQAAVAGQVPAAASVSLPAAQIAPWASASASAWLRAAGRAWAPWSSQEPTLPLPRGRGTYRAPGRRRIPPGPRPRASRQREWTSHAGCRFPYALVALSSSPDSLSYCARSCRSNPVPHRDYRPGFWIVLAGADRRPIARPAPGSEVHEPGERAGRHPERREDPVEHDQGKRHSGTGGFGFMQAPPPPTPPAAARAT